MGKLRWEGARPDAGRDEAVEIVAESFAGRKRDSMLDGEEIVCNKTCVMDAKSWQ